MPHRFSWQHWQIKFSSDIFLVFQSITRLLRRHFLTSVSEWNGQFFCKFFGPETILSTSIPRPKKNWCLIKYDFRVVMISVACRCNIILWFFSPWLRKNPNEYIQYIHTLLPSELYIKWYKYYCAFKIIIVEANIVLLVAFLLKGESF